MQLVLKKDFAFLHVNTHSNPVKESRYETFFQPLLNSLYSPGLILSLVVIS